MSQVIAALLGQCYPSRVLSDTHLARFSRRWVRSFLVRGSPCHYPQGLLLMLLLLFLLAYKEVTDTPVYFNSFRSFVSQWERSV